MKLLVGVAVLVVAVSAGCPENLKPTPCGYIRTFHGCTIISENNGEMSVSTNTTLDERCEQGKENCVCGNGEALFENKKCRPQAELDNECLLKFIQQVENTLPTIAGDVLKCKENEVTQTEGSARTFTCNKNKKIVVATKSFKKEKSECYCGFNGYGSYNGECVTKTEAVARCAAVTTPCPTNQVRSLNDCQQESDFECTAEAGSGKTTPRKVCKIAGKCYCPSKGFVVADGKCISQTAALIKCTENFAEANKTCSDPNETLAKCGPEATYNGCVPITEGVFEKFADVSDKPRECHKEVENYLLCTCKPGYARHSVYNKCVSLKDTEDNCLQKIADPNFDMFK